MSETLNQVLNSLPQVLGQVAQTRQRDEQRAQQQRQFQAEQQRLQDAADRKEIFDMFKNFNDPNTGAIFLEGIANDPENSAAQIDIANDLLPAITAQAVSNEQFNDFVETAGNQELSAFASDLNNPEGQRTIAKNKVGRNISISREQRQLFNLGQAATTTARKERFVQKALASEIDLPNKESAKLALDEGLVDEAFKLLNRSQAENALLEVFKSLGIGGEQQTARQPVITGDSVTVGGRRGQVIERDDQGNPSAIRFEDGTEVTVE